MLAAMMVEKMAVYLVHMKDSLRVVWLERQKVDQTAVYWVVMLVGDLVDKLVYMPVDTSVGSLVALLASVKDVEKVELMAVSLVVQ